MDWTKKRRRRLARELQIARVMTTHALAEQLARLDDEIQHLQHRTTAAAAGLAEHIMLEAARRMRIVIATEIAQQTRSLQPAPAS